MDVQLVQYLCAALDTKTFTQARRLIYSGVIRVNGEVTKDVDMKVSYKSTIEIRRRGEWHLLHGAQS